MTTAVLESERPVSGEVEELRKDVERLKSAIGGMSRAMAEANGARGRAEGQRDAAERELAEHRLMLGEALELQTVLERRLRGLERALARQRTLSAIRGTLLTDLLQARWWRRRPAIERAARVERLLARCQKSQ